MIAFCLFIVYLFSELFSLTLCCEHFSVLVFENTYSCALPGVAQLVGHQPADGKVSGSIPGQGTGLGCWLGPWLGLV